MRALRPHQINGKALLRSSVARGALRPIVQMPTGAGKTWFAADIIESHFTKVPNGKVVFIVDAISLIDQTVQAFYDHGLAGIGVIQADHIMQDWSKPVQVASVQTLQRRGMPEGVTLVIVDECHRQNAWLHNLMASEDYANVLFIGLSATPWSKGLGNVFDDLIIPVTMQELIDAGYLSPFRVFAAAHPDLSGVKVTNTAHGRDYDSNQLAETMSDGGLVADIVDTWIMRAEDRPTFVFCVDRAHAKKVQRRFEEAGVGCGYIDAYTEIRERHAIRRQLEAREIQVVANVACLTTGVDWPIGCIVLARPTKSEMLFVQMVGRGLRVNEGMSDCIILDHADNTLRLGFVTDIHHDQLCTAKKGERTRQEQLAPLPKECPSCTYLKPPKVHECPSCGFKPERRSEIEEGQGELIQITRSKINASKEEKQRWYSELYAYSMERRFSNPRGWTSNTYKKRFGVWPQGLVQVPAKNISSEVRSYAKYVLIAFAKSRKVAA